MIQITTSTNINPLLNVCQVAWAITCINEHLAKLKTPERHAYRAYNNDNVCCFTMQMPEWLSTTPTDVIITMPDNDDEESQRHLDQAWSAFYGVMPGKIWASRCIKVHKYYQTREITAEIATPEVGGINYQLLNLYPGPYRPLEPGDTKLKPEDLVESRAFWCKAAFAILQPQQD